MIQVYNKIDTSDVKVEKIGPSTFNYLFNGCKYSYLLTHTKNIDRRAILPNPKNTILGTIIHSLFEKRIKGLIQTEKDFEEIWEEEICREENRITQTYGIKDYSLVDYDKMYSAMATALNMPQVNKLNKVNGVIQHDSSSPISVELPVETEYLIGKIDKVERDNNGVKIIDFKTGKIIDEDTGSIKEDYIAQLNLYSHMFESVEGVKASELEIIDVDGKTYNVPQWPDTKLQNTLKDVKDLIDELNSGKGELLTYTSEKCAFCSARMTCHAYWNSPYRIASDDEDPTKVFEDKEVQVSSIVNRDVIEYKGGRIKGMSRFNEELELGKTYRIRGLIFNGNNYEFGELYSTCEQSVVVELI